MLYSLQLEKGVAEGVKGRRPGLGDGGISLVKTSCFTLGSNRLLHAGVLDRACQHK